MCWVARETLNLVRMDMVGEVHPLKADLEKVIADLGHIAGMFENEEEYRRSRKVTG